ncbi:cell growth regulator with RING finger domain protein 1 [Gouania willdenowi]|uniref:RING-type domain-containing protein n=1 Tax=Gouania willdenowi TaxID=441366 RepID=A0A8C5ESL5_GOUWI|nr:cell growth regulator with RING finger domain protein 1 [Gouania willdenowi]
MAAVFLVTVYEYSPLFYITVVSLCFLVTAAMVLGWFGFDVPVILRGAHEPVSTPTTTEKQMVQMTNPFALELGLGPACVSDGVSLRGCCLKPCVLSCFWGCEVSALQGALQVHQHSTPLCSYQRLQEALDHRYLYYQRFHIGSEDEGEHRTQIPDELSVTDFGPLPRKRYPLVAVLMAEEPEAADHCSIVASMTVLHVPDEKHKLSARVLFQYLLTSQGTMYELKPLFMSADSESVSAHLDSEQSNEHSEASRREQVPAQQEENDQEECVWSEGVARGCVVCQNAAVNQVLLPCRHACVCDSCVSHFQHCPICRAFIMESFALRQRAQQSQPSTLDQDI